MPARSGGGHLDTFVALGLGDVTVVQAHVGDFRRGRDLEFDGLPGLKARGHGVGTGNSVADRPAEGLGDGGFDGGGRFGSAGLLEAGRHQRDVLIDIRQAVQPVAA